MIQKIIHRIMLKRHFWRVVGYDELSEIYASMFLRSLALSIIGIFIPIYLYTIGYSLTSIFLFIAIWFAGRFVFAPFATKIIGYIGPKHSIAYSTVLHIAYLALLLSIQDLRWPLFILALVGAFANSLFLISFEVDFSKVKHREHGGKEFGYEQMFERIGAVIGPIVGGLIASYIEPRYSIALAIIVLCASLLPIFASAEPVRTRQTITVKGFPWRRHKRDFFSAGAVGLENAISVNLWPIFIAVLILTENTFAKLGVLVSVSTAMALIANYSIGKLIDDRKGLVLLKVGAISNAVLHLFRPFVTGFGQILGINLINEPLTIAYRMPYLKGRFDTADQVVGYRAVYFMVNDMAVSAVNTIFWLVLCLLTTQFDSTNVMRSGFIVGAIASLLILTQRFSSLRR